MVGPAAVTPEQLLSWVTAQDGRYELVDGEVMMMAGATMPSS
ncbi:hypothetical protein ACVIJ6_003470 [Bradyrhizobium sp. USDA 4369]